MWHGKGGVVHEQGVFSVKILETLGLRCGKILDGDWYIVNIVEGVGLLVVLNKELFKFVDM